MRYIDIDAVLRQPGVPALVERAEAARQEISGASTKEERDALIDRHRPVWVAFRAHFEAEFGAKCWYIECRNPGTDDDVDHFRPKRRVAEREDHPGYWWLALSWRNFRLSCHRANRRRRHPESGATFGKGDHFPLVEEAARWIDPGAACTEAPKLLDPTDPEDPPLLTFNIDGSVALAESHKADPVAVLRFNASRDYLDLDWPDFVEGRRAVFAEVYRLVERGDGAAAAIDRQEPGAKESMKHTARDLIALTRHSQDYSRAAAAYVHTFKDRPWMRRNVLPHVAAPQETEVA